MSYTEPDGRFPNYVSVRLTPAENITWIQNQDPTQNTALRIVATSP